ncbi:MAG: prenyltransferase [Polyangiaceae bacterium]
MFSIFARKLNPERARKIAGEVMDAAENESKEVAWTKAQPLLKGSKELRDAAVGLVLLAKEHAFEREQALEAFAAVASDYPNDPEMLGLLGEGFEGLCDIRYLNAAPPEDPVLLEIAASLLQLERSGGVSGDEEVALLRGLSVAARLLGRAWDDVTERCEKRLVELKPDNWQLHYNLGLFYKTRGRFEEGCAANQEAFDRGGAEDKAVQWNLGICATGARNSERALQVWKSFGHKIEVGRFLLPDGPYPDLKVRLAQFPLAERAGLERDEPGFEETVWVERLSPCHGIIRVAVFQDLGVDYGDAILFDGAPITYHEVNGESVPVLPHLATLKRSGYRILPFGGTQQATGQIVQLSEHLPADTVLYPHTENLEFVCQECWESSRPHQHHADMPEHRVVTGKLCIPPDLDPLDILKAIDRAVAESGAVQLFIPELCALVGDTERAEVESRRLAMIQENK